MTSLFDLSQPARSSLPVELVRGGMRGVSPLEFFTIEDEERASAGVAEAIPSSPEHLANERARSTQAMLAAARDEAAEETRNIMHVEYDTRLHDERLRLDRLCKEFSADRQRFFDAAEAQVVRLALTIARRVLAREVEGDPLHLTAIVRAALSHVQDDSATVLRVPRSDVAGWSAIFAEGTSCKVQVIGDDGLGYGDCRLETRIGRIDLGVETQLAEVERGFNGLLRRQAE